MLGSVLAKSVRDRWLGEVVGATSIVALLVFTLWVYDSVDTSFYYDLPPAMLDTMGISEVVGGLGGLAYGSIYVLMGGLTLAGIAISVGASSIAGEERDGTLGLLLGNPHGRTAVLGSKVGALVVLTALGSLVLWAGGAAAPVLLGTEVAGVRVAALVLHIAANALFWGMLATAVGAWTGNRTAASGAAAVAMVGSWLAASLLPLFEGGTGVAEFVPWYWFSGSRPEANGIDGLHLGLLVAGAVSFGAVAFVGVERRDLRERRGRTTLLDRLRDHPLAARLADRRGSSRVSSIAAKSTSDQEGLLVVVAGILFSMSLAYSLLFNLLPAAFTDALAGFPDSLLALVGQADMSTPEGWLQGELFSITIPIGLVAVLASVGATSVAGEEAARTMGLLLANPVPRRRVLLAKAAAMAGYAVVLGVAVFVGVTIGVLVGGLGVPVSNLAATTVLATLLGLAVGSVAFLVGAATGRTRPAVMGATGAALAAWVAWSFLPLSDDLAGWAGASPFDWYLGSDPLANGMAWGDAALLVGVTVALVTLSIPLFERRDLRG